MANYFAKLCNLVCSLPIEVFRRYIESQNAIMPTLGAR